MSQIWRNIFGIFPLFYNGDAVSQAPAAMPGLFCTEVWHVRCSSPPKFQSTPHSHVQHWSWLNWVHPTFQRCLAHLSDGNPDGARHSSTVLPLFHHANVFSPSPVNTPRWICICTISSWPKCLTLIFATRPWSGPLKSVPSAPFTSSAVADPDRYMDVCGNLPDPRSGSSWGAHSCICWMLCMYRSATRAIKTFHQTLTWHPKESSRLPCIFSALVMIALRD